MANKLYVGNLTYGMTDNDLQNLFEPHGTVQSAKVIMDRETGRSKGLGFVEMDSKEEAQAAIAALSDQDVNGRKLTVNEGDLVRSEAAAGVGMDLLVAVAAVAIKTLTA